MSTAAGSALQTKTISLPPRNSPGVGTGSRSANVIAAHPLIAAQCLAFVLALIAAAECHSITIQSYPGYPILPSLLYGLVLWCWWGIAAAALWKFAERSGKDFFSLSSAAKYICVGVLVAAAHVIMLQGFLDWSRQQWPVPGPVTYSYLNFNRFGSCPNENIAGYAGEAGVSFDGARIHHCVRSGRLCNSLRSSFGIERPLRERR